LSKVISFKVIGGASKPSGRKKDEDVDTSPLLQSNNLKNQRSIDEQKLKVFFVILYTLSWYVMKDTNYKFPFCHHDIFQVLKWNFTTPREEFVDLLKDQMTVANVNKTLLANMFHSDFKFHLKAIDALSEVSKASSQV
jgi:cytoskeleton-associated protein 5